MFKHKELAWTFKFDEVFPGGADEAIALVRMFEGRVNIGEPALVNNELWSEMSIYDSETLDKITSHLTDRGLTPDFRSRSKANLPAQASGTLH